MRVAVTGAAGRIGRILCSGLVDGFEVVPVVRRPGVPGATVADLSDVDALTSAFDGCDALVHLAGEATTNAPWERVLDANVIGVWNAFTAARRAGIRRVVFASSNHVVGMFEAEAGPRLHELSDPRQVDHRAEVRADSLYGVSKAFGEVLARYHVDQLGMEVICLRIGSVVDALDPDVASPGMDVWSLTPPEEVTRLRATWLSHADTIRLVSAALRTPTTWAVVYGTSANPRQIWDLEHARTAIGYVPVDAAPDRLWAQSSEGD